METRWNTDPTNRLAKGLDFALATRPFKANAIGNYSKQTKYSNFFGNSCVSVIRINNCSPTTFRSLGKTGGFPDLGNWTGECHRRTFRIRKITGKVEANALSSRPNLGNLSKNRRDIRLSHSLIKIPDSPLHYVFLLSKQVINLLN